MLHRLKGQWILIWTWALIAGRKWQARWSPRRCIGWAAGQMPSSSNNTSWPELGIASWPVVSGGLSFLSLGQGLKNVNNTSGSFLNAKSVSIIDLRGLLGIELGSGQWDIARVSPGVERKRVV